jgi:hypothetical protein
MERQTRFVVIISIVNFILFCIALYFASNVLIPAFYKPGNTGYPSGTFGLFLLIFPLAVASITLFIVKIILKFEMVRAWKYFHVAYFASYVAPVGLAYVLSLFARIAVQPMYGVVQPKYGVRLDSAVEQCYNTCANAVNKTAEWLITCYENCRK